MKLAYIAIALRSRQIMQAEIEAICTALKSLQITPFIFVDSYHFAPEDASEMMRIAKKHMDESDLLIAEVTQKAIGVGIEVGYMTARNKTVIYLRRSGADYSTTVGGIADYEIVYQDTADLQAQLTSLIRHQKL